MSKKNKKIMAKVIAGGMLISNLPIQTFANEIETLISDTSNIKENINNEEVNNSGIEDRTETIDSNSLENENTTSKDIYLTDSQITAEDLKMEDKTPLDTKDVEKDIITKEVEANKYIINNIEDLKKLREDININSLDTTDMIVELGDDIDFAGETSWEAIGTKENMFKGTFDGKNYTIKNINISDEFIGLFGNTDGITLKNLNFDNVNINSKNASSIGIIISIANNGINASNISFSNISIVANKASYIGGVAGIVPNAISNISNISFDGAIYSTNATVGGVSGMLFGNISDIQVYGNFEGNGYVGGIVGYLMGPSTGQRASIENVSINASFKNIKSINGYTGGVVGGASSSVSINNAYVEGDNILSDSYSGGIIGSMFGSSNKNETFISNAEVRTKKINGLIVGGIIGIYPTGDILTIDNCKVYSDIEGTNAGGVGGIATKTIIIKNTSVINQSIKGNDISAGILGLSTDKVTLENNIVESNITSIKKSSGIVTDVANGYSSAIKNVFKGTVEVTSIEGKASGLSTNWNSSNSTILGNKIEGEIISKGNDVGGLIGKISSSNTIIEDNTVKVTISANNMVGGLIGQTLINNIKINNNNINVIISANNQVGGLGGLLAGPSITNNKIISNIKANDSVGGIVGETTNSETLYSKNIVSTNIISNSKIGGLMGNGSSVQMNNNFIGGSISGKSQIGGVIGYTSDTMSSPMVLDTIIAMTIKGESLINSVVGEAKNDIAIQNVYYDTNLTELTDVYGIGLTTEQMQGKEAQENMNLDFENIWKVNKEYYPTFEQINTAPDIVLKDKVINETITINQYDKFNIMDYITVEDFEGDEVTISIKNTKESFDTSRYGVFPITIVATDDKGLSSELLVTLNINPTSVKINEAPVIIAEDITLIVGDEFKPSKVIIAVDKEDGIITENVKILENTVNVNKAGVYKVTYEIIDKDGAKTTKTIIVTVKEKIASNNTTQNHSNTTEKDNTEKDNNNIEKPQTNDDVGTINIISVLMSVIGLFVINKKKDI